MTMKKAVLYARVSSAEQEREGYSIPAQISLIEQYANNQGYQIMEYFVESESAKKAGRRQFNAMLKFLDDNLDVQHLLVEKTDRLYRNMKDHVLLDAEGRDIEIHLVKENNIFGRDSKSDQKFMHGIQLLMAKRYCDNLSEEVKKGMNTKAAMGHFPSSPPLGYTTINVSGQRRLAIDEERAPYVKKAFELAATGNYSLQKITAILKEDGFRNKKGNAVARSCIHNLLRRELYRGTYKWEGVPYVGKHESIVTPELFEKVQEALKDRGKPQYSKHSFTYSGMLKCGHCGAAISAEIHKRKYIYYRCANGKCEQMTFLREEKLEQQAAQALQGIKLPDNAVELTRKALKESMAEEQTYRNNQLRSLNSRRTKLLKLQDAIYEDKLNGDITTEEWKQQKARYNDESNEILRKIQAHEAANDEYMLTGIKILELAEKAGQLYYGLTKEEKRDMLKLVFSNSVITSGTLCYNYRKPFDMFVETPTCTEWLGYLDSNQGSRYQKPMPYHLAIPQHRGVF